MLTKIVKLGSVAVAGCLLLAACRKQADMGKKEIPPATAPQKLIPVSNRQALHTQFRQMLKLQGVTDENQVQNFLNRQEEQILALEKFSKEKKEAVAQTNAIYSPTPCQNLASDWCITPSMLYLGQPGYAPMVDLLYTAGTVTNAPVYENSCSDKWADYMLPDFGCPSSHVGVRIGLNAQKLDWLNMRINFNVHVQNHGSTLTNAQIYIYQLGNDYNWYLAYYVPGTIAGNGNMLPANIVNDVQDNFRYYSIQVWTQQLSTWCGTAGDGLWKVSHTGLTVTDTDCWYQPPSLNN